MNYKYINFNSIYVLVKSEYIGYEYEYEYMTHQLYEYEYLKNVLEYFCPGLIYIYVKIYIYTIYIYTCLYIYIYIYVMCSSFSYNARRFPNKSVTM